MRRRVQGTHSDWPHHSTDRSLGDVDRRLDPTNHSKWARHDMASCGLCSHVDRAIHKSDHTPHGNNREARGIPSHDGQHASLRSNAAHSNLQ